MENIDGILFDRKATNTYRDVYNEQCGCASCLLFYKDFETQYVDIVSYLRQFGIDINYPLTTMDISGEEDSYKNEYVIYYSVKGKLPVDKMKDKIAEVDVTLRNLNVADEVYANTGMKEPYFIIELNRIIIYGDTSD